MSGLSNLLHFIVSHGRAAALALAMSVLVFSPVAEAVACSGEVELMVSQLDDQIGKSGSEEPEHAPQRDDGGCLHGHCHHNNQPWNHDHRGTALRISTDSYAFGGPDDQGPSAVLELLKPPPRA